MICPLDRESDAEYIKRSDAISLTITNQRCQSVPERERLQQAYAMFRFVAILSLPCVMATVSHQSGNTIFRGNHYAGLPGQYPGAVLPGFQPLPRGIPVRPHGQIAVPAYPVSAGVRLARPSPASLVGPRYDDGLRYPPTPYAFDYAANSVDGSHSRTERGDGAGRVTGSYSIQLADGRSRLVEYIADEGGYRANIRTNEFGTESQNPADVVLQSSAIPAREAVLLGERDPAFRQYGPAHHK